MSTASNIRKANPQTPRSSDAVPKLFTLGFICLFSLLISGCNRKTPRFEPHPLGNSVQPKVAEAVHREVNNLLGTVDKLRAPLWLPLQTPSDALEIVDTTTEAPGALQFRLNNVPVKPGTLFWRFNPALHDSASLPESFSDQLLNQTQFSICGSALKNQPVSASELSIPIEALVPDTEFLPFAQFDLTTAQQLYQKNCQLCHGLSGAGDGSHSQMLNPKPRDFRPGVFKYTSTGARYKAASADLKNTIKNGIAGTGMPAFKLLGNHEIALLVDYVKYLAVRGEVEQQLYQEAAVDFPVDEQITQQDIQEYLEQDLPKIAPELAWQISADWMIAEAPEHQILPVNSPPTPQAIVETGDRLSSLSRGEKLFRSTDLQCAACHGRDGKGNGEQTQIRHKKPDGSLYEAIGLHDDWGYPVKPRDLTYGVFHGGREPIDLYRRIAAGVKGTPMPAYGNKGLTEAEIWDLVNYCYYLAGEFPDIKQFDISDGPK